MSRTIQPTIALLFDNELRVAAAACHRLNALLEETPRNEEAVRVAMQDQFHACHVALYHVRPEVSAITVINPENRLPKKGRRDEP